MHVAAPDAIDAYLKRHEDSRLLRFITCGSVDDGKSTLIGRLLFDSKRLFDDQLAALAADSRRHGTRGGEIDYALLLDGLAAEREQGITIDVAWRYFATDRRRFIVADCPGHEQYTRNMATGASQAELAIVLVDARRGVLTQTRRHSYILSLFGVRHVVLAVNKMDLVDHSQRRFDRIASDYLELAEQLGISRVTCIPMSALEGDNLSTPSRAMPWYAGPTLLEHLETVEIADPAEAGALRMPVQWVNRPHQDFRGLAGTVAAGTAVPGDEVVALPSGRRSRIARVLRADGSDAPAVAGEAVTLVLADQIDVARGDVIAAAADPVQVADGFAVRLLWMDDAPLLPGRRYLMKLGTRSVPASVGEIRHRVDVNTQQEIAARRLELNEVGLCHLVAEAPVAYAPFVRDRTLGGFILIDRETNATAAVGTIEHALRRAENVHWSAAGVDAAARARIKGQRPRVVWFTGLSGAGKSTIAGRVEERLNARGLHSFLLDGDNLRHGLNRDLGFGEVDRVENVRRAAEVARLMADAGLIVLVSLISPFRADREMARARFAGDEFVEAFVDVPLAVAEARDPKGLYRKARSGAIANFTGIGSPYEPPAAPELHLDAAARTVDELADAVLAALGID
nr:sulfate adenylyltransferase subunit CysN [Coralloluteibacterium stylophorae]